jgi:hypothetical protein
MNTITDRRDLPLFIHSVIDDMTNLTPNAMRVYMHLARRADKSGKAWPSYQAIGDHCFAAVSDNEATRKTFARKAVDELIAAGLVVKEERARDDGGQTSNAYVLINPPVSISTPMPISTPVSIKHPPVLNEQAPCLSSTKDTPLEDTPLEEREEEETHAHDPLLVAWQQAYTGVDMPSKLGASLQELIAECGMAATIHGIKASATNPNGRNFRYIAECARNYVPPPPLASYANGNPYTIDIPGIVELPAAKQTAPVLPPPMAHDDPWTIALSELSAVLPGSAPRWLQGSSLKENGVLAGVPLYRVTLKCPEADPGWLRQQAEPAIRKKLASLLGKRIMLEIVNPHKEYAA